MKAWELNGFGLEQLKLVEKSVPKPAGNELLVHVSAVSLNYRDKLLYDRLHNPDLRFPMIPVADAAGEVVEVGRDVTRFSAGDRIISHYATKWLDGEGHLDDSVHTLGNTISGALAEYIVLDEQAVVAKPDYLSDEEASTLPVAALTAWYALVEKGQLKAGQTVLIEGTGGVSIFGLQLASALGAKPIVTSSSDEKLARAKSLGAVHGINYVRLPDWEKAVLDFTAQEGVDHVLEVVGGDNLARSLAACESWRTNLRDRGPSRRDFEHRFVLLVSEESDLSRHWGCGAATRVRGDEQSTLTMQTTTRHRRRVSLCRCDLSVPSFGARRLRQGRDPRSGVIVLGGR